MQANQSTAKAAVSATEKLTAMMILSMIFHGIMLFGIDFKPDDPASRRHTLDVVLSQSASEEAPEKADFLAASNQVGGGDRDKAERPSEPVPAEVPKDTPGLAPKEVKAGSPEPLPTSPETLVTTTDQTSPVERLLKQKDKSKELPNAKELIEQDMQMAKLAAEIERRRQQYAKRPKKKYISANTKEHVFASYMRGWVARVERIGNVNYPNEARERKLEGSLVMVVGIKKDGSVESIDIIESSGIALLDDAAVNIVTLSAPFPPIPETDEGIDILHITRTWQFLATGEILYR